MRSAFWQGPLAGLLLGATLPTLAAAQQGDVRVIHEPLQATPDPSYDTPPVMHGERVTESFGWVETMEESMARAALEEPKPFVNDKARNGRDGSWIIVSLRDAHFAHSGSHYVMNQWGDVRMGIAFRRAVDLSGAWFVGADAGPADAQGVRAIGYRNGQVVGGTDWFRDLDREPSFFAMNLAGVDRIELVAEPGYGEIGFYGFDDLAYTEVGTGVEHLLDFEDLEYKDRLTGSGYAGLVWESGTGFTSDVDAVPPPQGTTGGPATQGSGAPGGGAGFSDRFGTFTGNGTLPILLQNFMGPALGDPGANFIPPDTCGAVGTNHFVTVVNSNFSVFLKAAPNTRVINQSMTSFFNAGGTLGDPRVVWDPDSGRFIVIIENFSNRIYVAVSHTDDPTGTWFKGWFNPSQGSDTGKWPDYVTLGVDQRGIYTSAYMVGGSALMTLFALEKAPLVAANPAFGVITAFRSLPWEGAIQPAVHWDDAGGAYAVSYNGSSRLRIRRVDPPLTNPTLVAVGFVNLSDTWGVPPNAPVLGGQPLDTLDGRLMNSVYRNGSLWTTHCINTGGRAGCRYYEVNPATLAEIQLGTVRDNINQLLYFFMPSVAVNSQGHAVLGGTVSNSAQWAGCFYTGRLASDPPGEMAFPFEYRTGQGNYTLGGGSGYQRWGDYSLTSADPVDDTVWTVQEFAGTGNRWRLNIAQLDFQDTCTFTKYCNPASGSTNNTATIDATGCGLGGSLTVSMANAPASQFTYLLIGNGNSIVSQPPGAIGDLCVVGGSCLGRYAKDVGQITAGGTFGTDISNSLSGGPNFGIPVCGGNIQSGETWNFQYWHRQPMGAPSTFSEALTITFQ